MKGRKKIFVLAGSLVLVGCLALVTILNSSAISRQLHAWKLLPEPERLTELYFTDHAKLPSTYTPGDTQTVAFTVHNLEGRTTDYRYQITQSTADGGQATVLYSGNLTLRQNQTLQISQAVILTDLGPKSRVNVVLDTDNSSQSIFYIITHGGGQL